MTGAYVSDERAHMVARETLAAFTAGNLHSRSSLLDIARRVRDILADEGLNTRWSLCVMIAKRARYMWFARVRNTKAQIERGKL